MAVSSIWAPIGEQGPPGPQGPEGPAGPEGPPGPDTVQFAIDLADTTNGLKGVNLVGGASRTVANIAALKALPKTGLKIAQTLGYYTSGDLGRGTYWLDIADVATADNGTTVHVATDGGRWKLLHDGVITSFQAGLKRDGTTNTTLQVVSDACIAAGAILWFGEGVWISAAVVLLTKANWGGNGLAHTFIKAANALNANFLSTTLGANQNDVSLANFTIDGNRANNTIGNALTIKGAAPKLTNINVINATEHGINTDFDLADAERSGGFQGIFTNVTIDRTGKHGWLHNGPTDSEFNNVIVLDAGLSTTASYYGIYSGVASKFNALHCWNRGSTTNVPLNQLYLATAGNVVTNSHIEGGMVPLKVVGNQNQIQAECYAPRGLYCAEVAGTANYLNLVLGANAAAVNLNYIGVALSGISNTLELVDGGCLNGAMQFLAGETNNIINVSGYHTSGTGVVGTPHISDQVFINIQGPGGVQFRQDYGIPFTPVGTSITPQGGTYSNASASMRYERRGKNVTVQAVAVIVAVGTGTGAVQLSLPFTSAAFGYCGTARDLGTGTMYQCYIQPSSNQLLMFTVTNGSPAYSGMSASITITYETV